MEGHGIDRMRLSFAPVYRQPPSSAAARRVRCLGRAVSRARVLPRTRCDHVLGKAGFWEGSGSLGHWILEDSIRGLLCENAQLTPANDSFAPSNTVHQGNKVIKTPVLVHLRIGWSV